MERRTKKNSGTAEVFRGSEKCGKDGCVVMGGIAIYTARPTLFPVTFPHEPGKGQLEIDTEVEVGRALPIEPDPSEYAD